MSTTGYLSLKSTLEVTKVFKKSSSPAFKGLKVGDILELTTPIKKAGRSSSGSKATYILCYNPQTGETSKLSFNQIGKTMDSFEFKELTLPTKVSLLNDVTLISQDTPELGTEMKGYERANSSYLDVNNKSLIHVMRCDGKGFGNFCKGLKKPFDEVFRNAMEKTMLSLCSELQGSFLGYTQSDEITVFFRTANENSEAYFNGNVQKLTSTLGSHATRKFSIYLKEEYNRLLEQGIKGLAKNNPTHMSEYSFTQWFEQENHIYLDKVLEGEFDCRVFSLPKERAFHNLRWRWLDCSRNAISMVAREHFSHKELQGKKTSDIKQMLKNKGVLLNKIQTRYLFGTAAYKVPKVLNKGTDRECTRTKWELDRKLSELPEKQELLQLF